MQTGPKQKYIDRALVLPLVGFLLLLPPLAGIFQLDILFLGIPFTGLYLFAVWGALIVGAALLSRPLQDSAEEADSLPEDSSETAENGPPTASND